MMNDIDAKSRNSIVSCINQNFFVEAGAGSGKTTMLVNRMVAMVEAGIDISKICAITFTKAAAGEFYERFQKLLILRSNPKLQWEAERAGSLPMPTDETRERCAKALQNIDLCFMGTIDTFCSMILSEHPSEAGIPSDSAILSDTDMKKLYKQIFVGICGGKYGDRLKKAADLYRRFFWNAEEVFMDGMSVLMNNRNVHFNFKQREELDADKVYAADKEAILKALDCLIAHPEYRYDGNASSRAAWDKIDSIAGTLRRNWNRNIDNVIQALTDMANLRVLLDALDRYSLSLSDCFERSGPKKKWLDCTVNFENGVLTKLEAARYEFSMTFFAECVPVIEDIMNKKGAMSFFDYLYYLRNMLKKDAAGDGKLIRYIYDRHSYYLIDEFQDTNPMQAEVFFYLTAEHPVEQWSACVPRQGSLFIVGDPKQSIYRFRSADVASFQRVKTLFEEHGGEILILSRNFRSTDRLISYFNRVFSELLQEQPSVQSKFEEIPLLGKVRDEFQGVFQYTSYSARLAELHDGKTDPVQIKNVIKQLVGQDKYKISVAGGEPRPIQYSDIMIITSGKSKLNGIMKELGKEDIPVKVEGKVPFETNEALKQIANIYGAVADTTDANALFSALTGKIIGFREEDLMKFRMAGGEISLMAAYEITTVSEPVTVNVMKHMERLRELSRKAINLSPAALFAEILDGYEVYRYVPAEKLEVVFYTLEILRNAEKSGEVVSLKDGIKFLNKLICGSTDQERCLSLDDTKNCVHMANLHKVKGLEAPIVILASASSNSRGTSLRVIHGENGSEGYIFTVTGETSKGNTKTHFGTKEFADEKSDEDVAGNAERDRLVYVAATRARNALIICDSVTSTGGGTKESHRSAWKALLGDGCPDIFEETAGTKPIVIPDPECGMVDSLYQQAKEESILRNRTAEAITYKTANPSRTRLSSKLSAEETDIIVDVPEGTPREAVTDEIHRFPALLGTMTHRLMEIMVSTKNTCDTNRAIDGIIREYRTPRNQPFEGKLTATLKKVAQMMTHGGYIQENAAPQDILNVLLSADEVYCEVPFCYKDETDGEVTVWNGIMDVIYCKEGGWHIIDYKTNADGTNLDKEYKAQLDAYRKAFKETTGYEADAYTYHIDI